mgnify:CR=1 FL=1
MSDEIKETYGYWVKTRLDDVLNEIDYLDAGETTYSNRDTRDRIKQLWEARNVFRRELEAMNEADYG